MKERILALGGASTGGGLSGVLDTIKQSRTGAFSNFECTGILDSTKELHGTECNGIPILGSTDIANIYTTWQTGKYDSVIISFMKNMDARKKLFEECSALEIPFANIIHPSVIISSGARIGRGNVIMAFSYLGPNAVVGDNNFMSTYTGIEHDCRVGSHNTFGPNVKFSGCVTVGDKVLFAMNIGVQPRITIGSNSIISSGCIITDNIPPNTVAKVNIKYIIRELAKEKYNG